MLIIYLYTIVYIYIYILLNYAVNYTLSYPVKLAWNSYTHISHSSILFVKFVISSTSHSVYLFYHLIYHVI